MKEAIVVLTLLGCDHGENNCAYIETASQTYGSEVACLRASEEQILDMADIEYPIVMADCKVQSLAVAEPEVEELLENDLHEPLLTSVEIEDAKSPTLEMRKRPFANALGTIKDRGGAAIGTVWQATVKSTSAINPF